MDNVLQLSDGSKLHLKEKFTGYEYITILDAKLDFSDNTTFNDFLSEVRQFTGLLCEKIEDKDGKEIQYTDNYFNTLSIDDAKAVLNKIATIVMEILKSEKKDSGK